MGLDSNYTISNSCFWRIITYDAVTLVLHIPVSFIVYSRLPLMARPFTFRGQDNSIFKSPK